MKNFNQFYNFLESNYDWYKRVKERVAHQKVVRNPSEQTVVVSRWIIKP